MFGCGAFGKELVSKGGALIHGISVLMEETPESSLPFLPQEGREKMAAYEPESGSSPDTETSGTLIVTFQPPKL